MPKVTSVEPQKKTLRRSLPRVESRGSGSSRRFNIYLDGEFAFGADEDLVVSRRLVVGKEIKIEDLERILFEADVGKLMERMYRIFNIRQRSEKEVREYFKKLSFKRKLKDQEELSSHIIDAAVAIMKQKGMINDEQFAKSWVESRSKKYGSQRIKQELYQKGIDREIIEVVISGQGTGDSEEVATKLLEKKLGRWKNLNLMHFRKKAYDLLLRAGFEYEVVKGIIEKYTKKR